MSEKGENMEEGHIGTCSGQGDGKRRLEVDVVKIH